MKRLSGISILLMLLMLGACSSSNIIADKNFSSSSANIDSVLSRIPDYNSSISTLQGEGKAIVSEPNNTQNVTLYFSANRNKSLITIKNRLGIEGGKILSRSDSLLIYNKIDKYVRIIPVQKGESSRINNLASVNLVDMMTIPLDLSTVKEISENETTYLISLQTGAKVYIDKKNYRIQQIDQQPDSELPYSRIIYDAYDSIRGFLMPRRITIFSADGSSKVALLIQSLKVNPELDTLKIDLPENITIYRE